MKTAHFVVILSIDSLHLVVLYPLKSHSTNGFRRPASEDTHTDGFDEVAATKASISENFTYRQWALRSSCPTKKKKYINNRFGITL